MIKILALDFDGVICNGLLEYFQTTKLAYNQIWIKEKIINDDLAQSFYKLRPVIEIGWEMPILLRALVLNIQESEILNNWSEICQKILISEQLESDNIAKKVDQIRQNWIETDLESWLNLHTFYDGVINHLKRLINEGIKIYIITTKEGFFARKLLEKQNLNLPKNVIIGKEQKVPKYESLRQIIAHNQIKPHEVWFVEDRIPPLQLVKQQPDLEKIGLFLAQWGYNTEQMRNSLNNSSEIKLLSLSQFVNDFSHWLK